MAQENYVEGYSMQRPPLLESDGFFFWKTCFETYIKSKDIDLWQVIQNVDFVFKMKDPETNMDIETPYEKLKDNEKRQLGKNNEAKMTLYNGLPRKEYERVFMCQTAKEAELPLDELTGNLKVYEMVLRNDGVISKSTNEKVKSLALKAKVTRGQTSNDNVCQDGSDGDEDEEEEFDRGHGNRSKRVGSSRVKRNCYGCGSKNHLVDDCPKAKMKKVFVGGAWSDSEDDDQMKKDATCLMVISSQKGDEESKARAYGSGENASETSNYGSKEL
ncbi:zf-CCHC domain-containing protein [Tanacetum coccineum]